MPHLWVRLAWLVVLVGLGTSRGQAQVGGGGHPDASPDTLRLSEALAIALEANPALQAARVRAMVARERVPQAGALPDPMVSLVLMNRRVDGFGPSQAMTMNQILLSQRFPWPGTLGSSKRGAGHLAEASVLDAEELSRSLTARVTATYYRLGFVDRALVIGGETRDLLRDFHDVSAARYAVGSGLQQDLLQAQVAVARMTADITVLEQSRLATAARLNALLGRSADAPVGMLDLPAPGPAPPALNALMARASEMRPALRAAGERSLAAQAAVDAALSARYPDVSISLGYGQRPRFDDLATLMVGVSVPLWSGSKQGPRAREMEASRSEQEARELDLTNETFAQLAELRATAERARELSELYRTSILPQAQAAVESALSAYQVGRVDYMTLLTNLMTVNQFRTERVRLAAEYHEAVAGIDALTAQDTGVER
jgi:outer membrane protein TolC